MRHQDQCTELDDQRWDHFLNLIPALCRLPAPCRLCKLKHKPDAQKDKHHAAQQRIADRCRDPVRISLAQFKGINIDFIGLSAPDSPVNNRIKRGADAVLKHRYQCAANVTEQFRYVLLHPPRLFHGDVLLFLCCVYDISINRIILRAGKPR